MRFRRRGARGSSMGRAVIGLLLAASGVLAPRAVVEAAELRVGMETRLPPWSFVPDLPRRASPELSPAERAKLTGLDVQVMQALAARLSRTPVVVPTVWYDLEKHLLAGQFDVILSAWTPSPSTSAAIGASTPYCEWGLVVGVRADDPRVKAVADLGKLKLKVGHIDDPAVKRSLFALGGGRFEVRTTVPQLFADLQSGALDAVVYDSLYFRWRAKNQKDVREVGEPLNKLGYHVGVRKADADLLRNVDAALRALRESGELGRIQARWEGR